MSRSGTDPHGIGSYIEKINNEYIEKHGDTFIDESTGDVTTVYVEDAGLKTIPVPDTTLGPDDTVEVRFRIADTFTARFLEGHVFSENFATDGLVLSVLDSADVEIFSQNVTHQRAQPIATQPGPTDCYLQIHNTDIVEHRASGMVEYSLEET